MSKRAIEEVKVMIDRLEDSKKTLPQYSVFGDNNWLSVDKMVQVLRGEYPTMDDIYRDENTRSREITSSMCLAFDWMEGEVDDEEII